MNVLWDLGIRLAQRDILRQPCNMISIRVQKDPMWKWYDLSYLATDDAIDAVLDKWMAEWHTSTNLEVGGSKFSAQKKKEEAKLKMAQLVEKRKKEVAEKAQVEYIGKEVGKQTSGIEQGSYKGTQSPSPKTEKEDIEQHDTNP